MASSSDLRAIFSLPQSTPGASTSTTVKKAPGARKPEGISRELYSLIGDSAPSLVAQYAQPKYKPKLKFAKDSPTWTWKTFKNPGRKDKLELGHWTKHSGEEPEDYSFGKYNRPSQVVDYTQEEYTKLLQDDDWTKEETDYLFTLAREFDLRFLIMADRYKFTGGKDRRIEDLQDRYYAVCRRLIRNRPWAGDESSKTHTLSNYSFDVAQERMRKEYLRNLFNRTPEQIAEEEALYVEVKRLEANEKRWAKERDELLRTQLGVESGLSTLNTNWDVISGSNVLPASALGGLGGGGRAIKGMKREGTAELSSIPRKDRAYDITHCITRTDNLPTNTKSGTQAAHFRSTRVPIPKQASAAKITAILAENGISVSRLVMPTRPNVERLEMLQQAANMLFEVKKNLDRVEYEVARLKAQKEALEGEGAADADGDGDGDGEGEVDGGSEMDIEDDEDDEPHPEPLAQALLRKRSMSTSSAGTSNTTKGGNKRVRRD
ncbi:hypothetical protein DL93DRAFT_2083603 [Clavulina sp. PMI_390]|nr:hypothetical protein DL93DRAFT_2083603 [Clavulina sp. PMI_390]